MNSKKMFDAVLARAVEAELNRRNNETLRLALRDAEKQIDALKFTVAGLHTRVANADLGDGPRRLLCENVDDLIRELRRRSIARTVQESINRLEAALEAAKPHCDYIPF